MRVMFVDDEIQVLSGITRMLDSADVDWDIDTATSGAEALATFDEQPADVLVADMRMPGMDGAELLEEVSRRYPDTVRIVLSGQANKEAVYRAVNPMHQYLAKPCEADVLRETIARACALRQMLDSTKSHGFLGRISSLPSLPALYQEVVTEIESENGTLSHVGEIVSQDPAMTAKILQLVNSAIFGLRSEVSSPVQAASMIGMETLKSLVLSLQVFKSFDSTSLPGFSIDALTDHVFRVANTARAIGKLEAKGDELADESFTAGLLHDVGKLILAANAPEDYHSAINTSKEQNIPLIAAERTAFGLGHDGIGGYLLALWGLPQSIVEAVAFHHRPDQCLGNQLTTPAVVCVANFLAHEQCGTADAEQQQLFEELLSEHGFRDRLDAWRNAIRKQEN